MRLLTSRTIECGSSNVLRYTPFVASDGRVGYRITRQSDGAVSYVYLAPSEHSDQFQETDNSPDVFVYSGLTNDPPQDTPECYISVEFAGDDNEIKPPPRCTPDQLVCMNWPLCEHVDKREAQVA